MVVCGPKTAPPLVLLHGYMATLTMWSPNIEAFSKDYRVYAIDVMGQPGKSRPREPICTWFREDAAALFDLLAKRKIAPLVAARTPLVEARRAP